MVILALSAASALIFAYGVNNYLRCMRDPANDAMGRGMAPWIPISWGLIALVPALGAAGSVLVYYDRLDWPTRLIGLIPAILLLVPLLLLSLLWVILFFMKHFS
jgi:hypothetical protein